MKITKAIIPVGGLGTRFLPATKAQPKEMLTLVDKPIIQYIVEEAQEAGIKDIIFVTSFSKRSIEDHFDRNFELEFRLAQKNRKAEIEQLKKINKLARFAFVRQSEPLGDGHAILSALPFVENDEAVAVFFGDDVITADQPVIKQLINNYEQYGNPVIGLRSVPKKEISRYGVIAGVKIDQKTWDISQLVEKPEPDKAPSNLAVVGRYILTNQVLSMIKNQKPDKSGEIRLADILSNYLKKGKLHGLQFDGQLYDCGNKLDFLIAQVEFGLKHQDLGRQFRDHLKKLRL
ncbi:UTP--glucose-1-phosphate uridylyltransferase GalU [Candidatus Azambacteria bacterium]|nr:UTP--glucose-1-phosphate uridylyltransferase GalU [Candidatus Azambacteria bacterium]